MFSFRRASFPPTILANKPAIAVESALSCSAYERSRPCVNLRTKLTNILFGEYRLTQNDVSAVNCFTREAEKKQKLDELKEKIEPVKDAMSNCSSKLQDVKESGSPEDNYEVRKQ